METLTYNKKYHENHCLQNAQRCINAINREGRTPTFSTIKSYELYKDPETGKWTMPKHIYDYLKELGARNPSKKLMALKASISV